MRVLLHGLSPNLGGIERYLLNLVGSIDRSAFEFDVAHSDVGRPPALQDELSELGCRFHPVTPRSVSARRNRGELDALMASERFDLLHFNATSASYLAPVRAARRAGVPVVAHSHSSGGSSSPRARALHTGGRVSGVLRGTRNVAVSDEAGRWMFGSRGRWVVIRNGFDPSAFIFDSATRASTRHRLGVAGHLVVGHVGAFLPAKNHDLLVRVFAELVQRRPESALVLVGEGPSMGRVRLLCSDLGLDGRVQFLGRRTDIPELLAAMDVFVLPSLYEGSPLAVAEARAAGLPCVLSHAVPAAMSLERAARLPVGAGPETWAAAIEQLAVAGDRSPLSSGLPTIEEHARAMTGLYRDVIGCPP